MAKASTVALWGLALLCVAGAAPLESKADGEGKIRLTKKEAEAAPKAVGGDGVRITKKEADVVKKAGEDGRIRITKKEAEAEAVGGDGVRITKKVEEDVAEDAFRAPPVVITKGKIRAYVRAES